MPAGWSISSCEEELFQHEEKEMLKAAGLRPDNENDQKNERDNNVGIMPVYLCKRNKKAEEAASQILN